MNLQRRISAVRAAAENLEADLRIVASSCREEEKGSSVTKTDEEQEERAWPFLEEAADQSLGLLTLLFSIRSQVESARLRGFREEEDPTPHLKKPD